MKSFLHIFLVSAFTTYCFSVSCDLLAQTGGKKNMPSVLYKVQIAAYRNLNLAQLDVLNNVGKLFAEDAGNGVKRVVMGYYANDAEARTALLKVQEKGFDNAFIAVHKDVAIDAESALKLDAVAPDSDPTEVKTATAFHNMDDNNDFPDLADGQAYAVILNATDLVITQKLPDLLEWGQVFVPQNDPEANTMLGTFDTPEKALNALDYVQEQGCDKAALSIVDAETLTIISKDFKPAPVAESPSASEIPPSASTDEPSSEQTSGQTSGTSAEAITTTPADITAESAASTPTKPTPEEPAAKNPCDRENDADTKTSTSATSMPKEVSPEAVYRPHRNTPVSNTPDPAVTSQPVHTTPPSNRSDEPRSILSLPPEAIAGNISEAPETPTFSRFKTYFNNYDTVTSQIVIIAYDPTLDDAQANAGEESLQWDSNLAEINQRLRGIYMPNSLTVILDSLPKNDPDWSFYALFKYALGPMHDAYIVRAGKGEYHRDNNIYLSVYDKGVGDFTQTLLLSSVWGGGDVFGFQRSWLMDLDKDGIGGDILTHTTQEVSSAYDVLTPTYTLIARVWKDGSYIDAQIIDEIALKQQLGVN